MDEGQSAAEYRRDGADEDGICSHVICRFRVSLKPERGFCD